MTDTKREPIKEDTFEFNCVWSRFAFGLSYEYFNFEKLQPNLINIDFMFFSLNVVW